LQANNRESRVVKITPISAPQAVGYGKSDLTEKKDW
jgi:hypothetical protein